nr:odorant receptor [Semanotus bifasciatus]
MAVAYADDFFETNRWILYIGGLWWPKTYKNTLHKIIYISYSIANFLFCNLFFTPTEVISLGKTYKNIYFFIKNFSLAQMHVLGLTKVLFFVFRGYKMKAIISSLEDKKLHYEDCDEADFHPGVLSNRYKQVGKVAGIIYLLLPLVVILYAYSVNAVAAITYDENNPEKQLPDRLPFFSWMPFRYDTPETHLLALVYQATPLVSYSFSVIGMDFLFGNIMNCIALNLTIIQQAFLTIRERVAARVKGPLTSGDGLSNSDELQMEMNKEMKKIVQHLQVVYSVCDKLEDAHTYLTLAQTLSQLLILCASFYLTSMTPISNQLIIEGIYMFMVISPIMFYCYFGEEVTKKGGEIPLAIWQSDWLGATKAYKTSMLLTMARAQKPVHLTTGKFAPLTLATLVSIFKAAYSFCTFLKNSGNQ